MKSHLIRFLSLLLVLTMALSLTVPVTASAAGGTNRTVEIKVGETTTLRVTGLSSQVTWTSSDPEVAAVSADGVVTGLSAGTATITATAKFSIRFLWWNIGRTVTKVFQVTVLPAAQVEPEPTEPEPTEPEPTEPEPTEPEPTEPEPTEPEPTEPEPTEPEPTEPEPTEPEPTEPEPTEPEPTEPEPTEPEPTEPEPTEPEPTEPEPTEPEPTEPEPTEPEPTEPEPTEPPVEENVVDLTDKLNTLMRKNAVIMQDVLDEQGWWNAAVYFYNKVKDGGEWDIKLTDEWKFEAGKTYVYRGRVMRMDDPGNIHFGYVGAVVFTEEFLCFGAGLNNISKFGFSTGDFSSYYDDPQDQEMMRWGYALYEAEH